ncbi:MAG: hypothetical protein R2799_12945, partial [Crocinitomicaceae bacterium]
MKYFFRGMLALAIILYSFDYSYSCDGFDVNAISTTYIGGGVYEVTIEYCESPSNGTGSSVHGVLAIINGANIIGTSTPSITSNATGVTMNFNQLTPNSAEWGDWDNDGAPIFLDDGDPTECFTLVLQVDAAPTSVTFAGSSDATNLGSGFTQLNGRWSCNTVVAFPPPICNSDWSPPLFCVGETTPFDLNTTTAGTGTFTGTGVNSATGIFNPSGLSGNIAVTFTVGDAGFNCSTTHDIVFTDLTPPNLADQTICAGDVVALDATVNASAPNCDYTLVLDDSYGDGWESNAWFFPNDAWVDIYINGVLYMSGVDVQDCGNSTPCQNVITIPVNDGDVILLDYDSGDDNNENSMFLYDANGNLVASVSNPPNGVLGSGTTVVCGPGALDYTWSPSAGLSDPNIANPTASPATTTTYTVDIGSANLSCTGTASVTITVDPCLNCAMTSINVATGACDPGNTHQVTGTLEFQDPPATGTLVIEDCNGDGVTISPPFGTSANFAFTAQADGSTCAITAYF